MSELDFTGLGRLLLDRSREVVPTWLPGGKLVGHEWFCGDLRGGQGDSCRVNLTTGKWAEFAGNEAGGDLISLYASINGIGQGDAFRQLSEQYNYVPRGTSVANAPAPVKTPEVIAPPSKTSVPEMRHPKLGSPVAYWPYHDHSGQVLYYMARYDKPDKTGKEYLPWSYTARGWVCKAWPEPRPLYNLHLLHKYPNKQVIICEGEKSADAAYEITEGRCVCITWPNGAKAVNKANWTHLQGRKCLIWPDADAPGQMAANQISDILLPIAHEVKILDVTGQPDGWDAADAVRDGWKFDGFKEWAAPRAKLLEINVTVSEDTVPIPESLYVIYERVGMPLSGNGKPMNNMDSVVRLLDGIDDFKDILWFDEFHQRIFTRWNSDRVREWSDNDELRLCLLLQREYGLSRMSDDLVHKAAQLIAHRNPRNEPRDWMSTLVWDGTPRIGKFFPEYLGAPESSYTLAASRNWWISMVARIYKPGCQMDNMVILKGKQGRFKSTALRIIGGDWYSEAQESVLSKDFYMLLQGKLIIEIGELDTFDRAEVNTIKRVITAPKDRFRPPYGRGPMDFPRQCVFVGTTNEDLILRDHTGGRRFWPIDTGELNIDAITRDRVQLWAEAVAAFRAGEAWHIMPKDDTEQAQEDNRQYDEWELYINQYLETQFKTETTVVEVAKDCLHIGIDKLDKLTQMRIGRCLAALKWERQTQRRNGKPVKIWIKNLVPTTSGNSDGIW